MANRTVIHEPTRPNKYEDIEVAREVVRGYAPFKLAEVAYRTQWGQLTIAAKELADPMGLETAVIQWHYSAQSEYTGIWSSRSGTCTLLELIDRNLRQSMSMQNLYYKLNGSWWSNGREYDAEMSAHYDMLFGFARTAPLLASEVEYRAKALQIHLCPNCRSKKLVDGPYSAHQPESEGKRTTCRQCNWTGNPDEVIVQ